jgi:long-chain fatty acid transport protein
MREERRLRKQRLLRGVTPLKKPRICQPFKRLHPCFETHPTHRQHGVKGACSLAGRGAAPHISNYKTELQQAVKKGCKAAPHKILTVVFLCVALCLFIPLRADAAGFYLPGRGVSGMLRGGASIAGADSLQAFWYNPANLAAFHGFQLLVDAGLTIPTGSFQRANRVNEDGSVTQYERADNQATPLPIPSLLATYGWKEYGLTIGLGVYAPYAVPLTFSDTGPQRYGLIDMAGSLFLFTQASIAWSPHPRFRIGASVQNASVAVRLMTAASAYLGIFGAPEERDLDLYTEGRLNALFNISGNVGVWGRIVDAPSFKLDIAASVQMPVFVQGSGEMRVRLPTHPLFDPTTIEGNQVEASFWLPWIFRGALRATFWQGRADLEVAFVYETWSQHETISFTPAGSGIVLRNVPTIGDYRVPPIVIRRDWQDAFSVRVGGSVEIVPGWFRLIAGYAYETSAVPDEMFSVLIMDSNKHLISLGGRITWKNMFFEIGYGLYWMPEREIKNSRYKQLNPLNPEGASIIGNGRYNAMIHIVGLHWQAGF